MSTVPSKPLSPIIVADGKRLGNDDHPGANRDHRVVVGAELRRPEAGCR